MVWPVTPRRWREYVDNKVFEARLPAMRETFKEAEVEEGAEGEFSDDQRDAMIYSWFQMQSLQYHRSKVVLSWITVVWGYFAVIMVAWWAIARFW